MRNHPFRVVDVTYAQAVAEGCQVVQAKAIGEACRVTVKGGRARLVGYNETEKFAFPVDNTTLYCILIGSFFPAHRFPTEFVSVFDCTFVDNTDITNRSYRERFAHVVKLVHELNHPKFKLVPNYPITKAADLWTHLDPRLANGLIYRRFEDPFDTPLRVSRKYPEQPGGLP